MSYHRRWRRNHRMAESIARASSSDDSGTEDHNLINQRDASPNSDLPSRARGVIDAGQSSDLLSRDRDSDRDGDVTKSSDMYDEFYNMTEAEKMELKEEINEEFSQMTEDEKQKLEEDIASWSPKNNVTMTTAEFQKMVLYLLADMNQELKNMNKELGRNPSGYRLTNSNRLMHSDKTPQQVMCFEHVNELKDILNDFASSPQEHKLPMTTTEFQKKVLYSLIELRQHVRNTCQEFKGVCQELIDVKTACNKMSPSSRLTHINNMPHRVTCLNEPKETLTHADHRPRRLEPYRRSERKRHQRDC